MKVKKSITLDEEVITGLRRVMAALLREGFEKVNFSETINGLLSNNLVGNGIIEEYRDKVAN